MVSDKFGHVKISENVVACIAGLAATDVKGVAYLYGGVTHDAVTKADAVKLSRCIRVVISNEGIGVKIAVSVSQEIPVPEVTAAIQEKVKSSIETMTGNEVLFVDVTVSEVLL